jgi:hypothetical protein
MTSFTSRRIFAALLLGLTLAAPMAAASKPRAASETRPEVAATSLSGLLDRLWGLFSLGVHRKCGAMADPNGSCTSQPTSGASTPSDAGASADPNG